jgi:hypothetical protein
VVGRRSFAFRIGSSTAVDRYGYGSPPKRLPEGSLKRSRRVTWPELGTKPMPDLKRFAELSVPRQILVRLFQSINFGQIQDIAIRDGDPVFHPEPVVLVDVKLDAEKGERQEAALADFALRDEVRRLMEHLDELKTGKIERIEVRSGIPRRVIMERHLIKAIR